ncbi:MAG: TIGR01212 family radical SAM protein [Syntrophobacteraceae bacterium]
MINNLYRDYNSYLREQFGCRVQKISLDAGLTCPNRDGSKGVQGCIYCNDQGSGTGAARRGRSISEQIEEAKPYLAKRYKAKAFLGYFQSYTNTYASLPVLRRLYGEALADPDIVGLSIGTRPDCISNEILDHLAELSRSRLIWIEYGLQSAHDETLLRIRRGHTVEAFVDSVQRTRLRNIPICAHVILGLPGEGREKMLETARFLASQDIQAVKIHLLYVVRGTKLDEWLQCGKYKCLTRDEYISIVAEFLSFLPSHLIIQRLTGDPHPEELRAPAWALEKRQNREAIHSHMRRCGLYQGKAVL